MASTQLPPQSQQGAAYFGRCPRCRCHLEIGWVSRVAAALPADGPEWVLSGLLHSASHENP